MRILFDDEVNADVASLDRAWSGVETFAFVPRKSGLPPGWLERALASVPPFIQQGHFLLLTSGSTGYPKLVAGARDRAVALAKLLHRVQDSEPVGRTVLMLPLTYCYAFVNQWLWARQHRRELVQTRGLIDPTQLETALA